MPGRRGPQSMLGDTVSFVRLSVRHTLVLYSKMLQRRNTNRYHVIAAYIIYVKFHTESHNKTARLRRVVPVGWLEEGVFSADFRL